MMATWHDDMLEVVAGHLAPTGLRAFMRACKQWHRVVSAESFRARWLWMRASTSSPLHSPEQCQAYIRHVPQCSLFCAERLCLWASQMQQAHNTASPELLGLCDPVLHWIVSGLANAASGHQLLHWLMGLEAEAVRHAPADQAVYYRWRGLALEMLAWHGHGDQVLSMLQDTSLTDMPLAQQLACMGLPPDQFLNAVGHGGHMGLLKHCVGQYNAESHTEREAGQLALCATAASQGHTGAVSYLIGCGLNGWEHSSGIRSLVCKLAGQGRVEYVEMLTRCTCGLGHGGRSSGTGTGSGVQGGRGQPPAVVACPVATNKEFLLRILKAVQQASLPDSLKQQLRDRAQPGKAEWCGKSQGVVGVLAWVVHHYLGQQDTAAADTQELLQHMSLRGSLDWLCLVLSHPHVRSVLPDLHWRNLFTSISRDHRGSSAALAALMESSHDPVAVWQSWVDKASIMTPHQPLDLLIDIMNSNLNPRQHQQQQLTGTGLPHSPYLVKLFAASQLCIPQQCAAKALFQAVRTNKQAVIKALHAQLQSKDYDIKSSMEWAVMHGQLSAAQLLLRLEGSAAPKLLLHALQLPCVLAQPAAVDMLLQSALFASSGPAAACVSNAAWDVGESPGAEAPTCRQPMLSDGNWAVMLLQACADERQVESAQAMLSGWQKQHRLIAETRALLAREIQDQAAIIARTLGTAATQAAQNGHVGVLAWVIGALRDGCLPTWEQALRHNVLLVTCRAPDHLVQGLVDEALRGAATGHHAEALVHLLDQHLMFATACCGHLGQELVRLAVPNLTCVQALLVRGADPDAGTLRSAVVQGDTATLEVLLAAACPVGQAGETATWNQEVLSSCLVMAVEASGAACARLLIQHGADPSTPGLLLRACQSGCYKVVSLLLDCGADPCEVSASELKALAGQGVVDVVMLLRQAQQDASVPQNNHVPATMHGVTALALAANVHGV